MHGEMLPFTFRVGKTKIHIFDFIFLDHFKNISSHCNVSLFNCSGNGFAARLPGVLKIQIASGPFSPVRMRITSSTVETKIFPSPIRPVLAAC